MKPLAPETPAPRSGIRYGAVQLRLLRYGTIVAKNPRLRKL